MPVVEVNDRRVRYVVTNPAGQSVFVYDFPIESTDDTTGINVYVDDELTEDYTVDEEASEVTLDTPAAEDSVVVLEGATAAERELNYPLRGGLPSGRLNEEFNKVFYMVQELLRDRARALMLVPSAGDSISTSIPAPEANKVLMGNSDATGFTNGPTAATIAGAEAAAVAVEADLAAVESDLGAVETDLAATEADIIATAADKTATEADIVTVEADLAATESDLGAVETDLAATEADIILTAADKTATEADLTAVEADAGAVETDLASVESDTGTAIAAAASAEGDALATASDKTATEADLGAVETDLAATEADLAATESDLSSTEADAASAAKRGIVTVTGNDALELADVDKIRIYTGAGSHVDTIPANATVAFAVEDEIDFFNNGTGNWTITAAAAVIVNGQTAKSVVLPPYASGSLKKTDTNTWIWNGYFADGWA